MQRGLVQRLTQYPGQPPPLTREEFRTALGLADPATWALGELRDAIRSRSVDDVDDALSAAWALGLGRRWVEPFCDLLYEDWHYHHGIIAFELGHMRDPSSLPALMHAAYWIPEYLDWDESRDLAVKAIHAIGLLPGIEADAALDELLHHEDHALRVRVQRVIMRRRESDRR